MTTILVMSFMILKSSFSLNSCKYIKKLFKYNKLIRPLNISIKLIFKKNKVL